MSSVAAICCIPPHGLAAWNFHSLGGFLRTQRFKIKNRKPILIFVLISNLDISSLCSSGVAELEGAQDIPIASVKIFVIVEILKVQLPPTPDPATKVLMESDPITQSSDSVDPRNYLAPLKP